MSNSMRLNRYHCLIWVFNLIVLFGVTGRVLSAEPAPGLTISNGILLKSGKPYSGIGANYFSLFSRILANPQDTSSLTNLAALGQARIPFVRFMCGGFWPTEQKLYLENREEFFRRLDVVVRCAEANHVGLIPSLFWYLPTVPDLMGEPIDQLGNPDSKSIAFIRRYTADVVQRYQNSPAIWGWEMGNEYNLDADLPNAAQHRPPIHPALGTAASRSEHDEFKYAHLHTAYQAFAETVRKYDRSRIIISGNAVPRISAWHNFHEKSWTPDTPAQFKEILLRDNPNPMDTICTHLYPEAKNKYIGGTQTIAAAVELMNRTAKEAGKPLFLGEFGAERKLGAIEQQTAVFQEFLRAIQSSRVPLAAFWVFDLPSQDKDWDVTFQNDRAFMIDMVAKANAQLQKER